MHPKIKEIFKGDRKYFTIVFFIVALIIISGIFAPLYIDYKRNNWVDEVKEKIADIETTVKQLYKEEEGKLLTLQSSLRDELEHVLSPHNISYGRLIEVVNNPEYDNVSVQVIAPNGKIIAWNGDPALPQEALFPLAFPAGETYFHNAGLITYLTVLDTIHLESDLFYFIVSLPFEKKYHIQNNYYKEFSFINKISGVYFTQFEIDFTPYGMKTRDGRKYSFELTNNKDHQTAVVTFTRPAITVTENRVYNTVSVFQSSLALIAYIIAGLGFRQEYKQINKLLRLILFILYCIGFRALLFFIDFPSRLIEGPLTDPTNFSSAFGWGIVKSPLDLFLTVFFFLLISIQSYRYLTEFINQNKEIRFKSKLLFAVVVPATAFLFFITLRGLSASLRSVIFDSSLRYFKSPDIIPEMTVLFILITVLILAFSVVLFLSSFLIIAFKTIPDSERKVVPVYPLIILVVYGLVGIFYIETQPNPLITVFMGIIFLLVVWIFIYQVYPAGIKSVFNYVYALLIGSAIAITLLNFYNLDLEQESLKTTAAEINRPDENLIKFLVSEALTNPLQGTEIQGLFTRRNINYNAAAFIIWSNSALQRESLNSAVILYGSDSTEMGRFSVGINDEPDTGEIFSSLGKSSLSVNRLKGKESEDEYYTGIIPLINNDQPLGYIAAFVEFNPSSMAMTGLPDFLESGRKSINSVVEVSKLNIFQFSDSKLINVYGDLYPSIDQIKPIVQSVNNEKTEAWLSLSFNNEDYMTYVQAIDNTITAVSLKEKHISWRLFNFFKIFIIHAIVILLLFIILYIIAVRRIKYSFRTQLLVAFLIISVFPVLLLAFYNRQVVTESSTLAVNSELNERASYLQNHVEFQLRKHPERELITAFRNAGEELTVAFSIYENSNLIFSSAADYYNAGLFPEKINPKAYYHLNYLSFREYITEERVDDFVYSSFYKKINIRDQAYILGVNDAFNKITIPLAAADFDIFLFGVYSLAVLIIIIISTVLANKISAPVRKLTNATESLAHGDLNVNVPNTERGEMRDLIEGFNYMTGELRKNEIEMAQLERENAWKEMAKQVAHEIKNPLTPMKLAVQQLVISFRDKNKNFDEIFEKVSATLLNQIENLNQIASEFSRFARMPKFNLEEVDLLEILKDTVNLFIDEKVKVNIIADADKAVVESDKAQTRRIFINLIRNSIQASATLITVTLLNKDQSYNIIFTDNGEGIPDLLKEKIFDPSFTTKEKGMGIGLKISRRYLESIGGVIQLTSSSAEGTTFEITIPRKGII